MGSFLITHSSYAPGAFAQFKMRKLFNAKPLDRKLFSLRAPTCNYPASSPLKQKQTTNKNATCVFRHISYSGRGSWVVTSYFSCNKSCTKIENSLFTCRRTLFRSHVSYEVSNASCITHLIIVPSNKLIKIGV